MIESLIQNTKNAVISEILTEGIEGDLDTLISTYGYLKTHQSLENYYNKSETDSLLSNKSNTNHTHNYIKIYNSSSGNNGYERIAQIEVNGTYVDYPITFIIKRRTDLTNTTINIRLSGISGYDPNVSSFYVEGWCNKCYLFKNSTYNSNSGAKTVYDLYVQKGSAWDIIGLIGYNYINSNVNVSLNTDFITEPKPNWIGTSWKYYQGECYKAQRDEQGNVINTTYATKSELADYYNKSETYSDSEIDNLLGNKESQGAVAYCTCSTASGTNAKIVTVQSNDNWNLKIGSIIGVKFTNSNTANNVTLNVNNTGAKSIYYNTSVYTSNSTDVTGYTNRILYYMYDGTYWVHLKEGKITNSTYYPTISASHYSEFVCDDNGLSSDYNNIWSNNPVRSSDKSTWTRTSANIWSRCTTCEVGVNDTCIFDFDFIGDSTSVNNKIFHFYGTDENNNEKSSTAINGGSLGLSANKNYHITVITNPTSVGYYVDGRAITWINYARPVTQYFRFGINGTNVTLSFKNFKARKVTNEEVSEILENHLNGLKSKGSVTQPIYFDSNGLPQNTTYSLEKSVPSDADFTNTWRGIQDNLTSDSSNDSLSAKQGKTLKNLVDTKLDNNSILYESNLVWGNKNLTNSVTPLDMASYYEFNANRLAYLPPSCITVEHSTDGGTTWIDYGASNAQKVQFVTLSQNFVAGKSSTIDYTKNRLRVTIDVTNFELYMTTRKILIYMCTCNATGSKVNIEHCKDNSSTWTNVGTYDLAGWSGWNSIPLNIVFGRYSNQRNHICKLRFTFSQTGGTGNLMVNKLRLLGETCWVSPSTLANTGNIYEFDVNQNTTFPSNITSEAFIKRNGTSSQFLKANGSVDDTSYARESDLIYHTTDTNNPHYVTNQQLGNGYGTCSTASSTFEKQVTLNGFQLKIGGIVSILFNHAVLSGSSLNINNTGAKDIYYDGELLNSGVILANELCLFIYDGSHYNLISNKLELTDADIKTVQGVSLIGSGNVSIMESELVRRSFTVLNELISGTPDGGTIYLIGFYDYTSSTDSQYQNGIAINKDITIIGVDCTIDAHQLANVFNITNNSSVTLRNIEFNNTSNDRAINITNSDLILYDCTFNNCADGAIEANSSTLELFNCNFNQCRTRNTSNSYGGALLLVNSDIMLMDSSFINNMGYDKGGAVHIQGKKTNQSIINNCIFENNMLSRSSGFVGQFILGSAISQYGGDVLYFDNIFINNQGSSALSIDPPVVIISYVNNCKFYNNSGAIQRLSQYYTGVNYGDNDTYEEGDVVLVNCTFYTDTDTYENIDKTINCVNGSTTSFLSTTTNGELFDDLLDSLNNYNLEFDDTTGELTFTYVEYELESEGE